MRELIASIVRDLAFRIVECGDGGEALQACRRWRADWVLMDIRMGSVDGLMATRQIRSACPYARVVMVTDHDDPDLRAAARAAGACGCVVKENLLSLRQVLTAPGGEDD